VLCCFVSEWGTPCAGAAFPQWQVITLTGGAVAFLPVTAPA
jgi:hypothetical protein